jgi:rSAM/selenodomain-associated transferase 1
MANKGPLLAVMAKFWAPGQVKTRLAASIGDQPAAELHRQFVAVTLSRMAGQGDPRWLAAAPPDALLELRQWSAAMPGNWTVVPQHGGDLGERMSRLFEAAFAAGFERVVLIGSDSPDLPTGRVEQAFQRLLEYPVVIGPSSDGGYYLIGASRSIPPIFDDMPWSTSSLADCTIRRLGQAGIACSLLEPWRDVDDHADLVALYERLVQKAAELDAPLIQLRQTLARWARSPAASVAGT